MKEGPNDQARYEEQSLELVGCHSLFLAATWEESSKTGDTTGLDYFRTTRCFTLFCKLWEILNPCEATLNCRVPSFSSAPFCSSISCLPSPSFSFQCHDGIFVFLLCTQTETWGLRHDVGSPTPFLGVGFFNARGLPTAVVSCLLL
jgi:hypothetical protein